MQSVHLLIISFLASLSVHCIRPVNPELLRAGTGNVELLEKPNEERKIWVVLVAGSKGWYNYRHQSDICHAYHVIRSHGVPEENIITMMYDDIARNKLNPYPGKIFNVPNGSDVYAGVRIDYSGIYVTPKNFLAVLSGNKVGVKGGSGKVVESTYNDHIFVYFTDHGGVGSVAFPNSMLTVKDLNFALKRMHKLKKFGRLVFYMEACESGSMFAKVLPKDINVYAVTASNSHESSWACYCDNSMKLPCLGDCFSINWIINSEKVDLNQETLASQFRIVKQITNTSHVMHYGDLKIASDYVADYLGHKKPTISNINADKADMSEDQSNESSTAWPSREVFIEMLKKRLQEAQTESDRKTLRQKIEKITMKRSYFQTFMISLVATIEPNQPHYQYFMQPSSPTAKSLNCFDDVIKAFHQLCFNFGHNPYVLKYTYVFSNLCNAEINSEIIIGAMTKTCGSIEIRGIL